MRILCFLLSVVSFGASLGAAQDSAQSSAPPRRAHHALAYDPVGERVILSGGSTPEDGGRRFTFYDDLWAFDGARWAFLGESGDRLSGSPMAYDSRRNRMVSFGGFDGASRADFRTLEGTAWRKLAPHPEVRAAEPGLVYDSKRDRLVTFGGSASLFETHGSTWEFNGSAWAVFAGASPPARQGHVMVFDEGRGQTVVFGGMGAAARGQQAPSLDDTWEYDGLKWSQRRSAGPSARFTAGATYDSKRAIVILFGGVGVDGFLGDTWSWDGNEWKQLATAGPEPRGMGYLAYDQKRDRVVLFGGRKGWPNGDLNDTWEWDGKVWTRIGAGQGSRSTPTR